MSTQHTLVTHLTRHPLLNHAHRMVVAVSGGPDSLALLHALCQVMPRHQLAVFHLDHGLRGAQSAADAQFVAAMAAQLGVAVQCDLADIATEAPTFRNLSEAARVVRYRRMAQYALVWHANAVLVAHTQDDQAETVMMRLLRGSGTSGLAAMRATTPWSAWAPAALAGHATLVRPLLDISRATIMDYCASAQLAPRHDPSNNNQQALRVRVRTQLLPQLRHEQPQITAILAHGATLAADDADFIDQMVRTYWPQVVTQMSGWVGFMPAPFGNLHVSLQRAIIRRAITHVYGTLRGVGLGHIEAIRLAILSDTMPTMSLPAPMQVIRHQRQIGIGMPLSIAAPAYVGAAQQLHLDQSLACGSFRLTLCTGIAAPHTRNPWCVTLHTAATYTVRTRQPADRIGIGHGRHRRVQDVLVDARIPASQRDTWPLVCSGDEVVWVVGVRVDPSACAQTGVAGVQISCLIADESTV